jgi:hypothetical protein
MKKELLATALAVAIGTVAAPVFAEDTPAAVLDAGIQAGHSMVTMAGVGLLGLVAIIVGIGFVVSLLKRS